MADATHPDRATVDQTPDPDEIDRTTAAERGSKMPSMPGTTMDPKKMIGFAAAAQAAATQAAYSRAVALQSGAIRSALDLGVLEGRRNLKYTVQGSSAIQPSEITDNGQFTALRFPNQRELPAFFAVNPDGSESIVPFDVRDEFVVIHGVFGQLRLRRGREVLCVFNEAPDFYGRDPKTGTASSVVERTTGQANGETK